MKWPSLSFPEPYDAQLRAPRQNVVPQTPTDSSVTQRSYAQLAAKNPNGRALRQFSIFAFGAACVLTSAVLTRRATIRKYLAIRPTGMFTPSNHVPKVSGALDAAEALGLATLNVVSYSAMLIGGGFWAFDITSLEDLQSKVGRTMNLEDSTNQVEELDQEIEDFLPVLMARMTGKSEAEIQILIEQAQKEGKVKKT